MDSFNKWPPGTAGKLSLKQHNGYSRAMGRQIVGDPEEEDKEKDKTGFHGISPEKDRQLKERLKNGETIPLSEALAIINSGQKVEN